MAQPPRQAENFQTIAGEAHSPSTFGAAINSVTRGTRLRSISTEPQPTFSAPYEATLTQQDNFVAKYLFSSSLKLNPLYHASTSSSFMDRATYSASRIFITRDSGRKTLNTSYFLGVLSLVAVHSPYRPYCARSTPAPFNDFGSTIGNDTGMNPFHEFGPGIRQMVKSHTPKFALKLGERITHSPKLREVVSSSAR